MNEHEARLAAMRVALQFAARVRLGIPRPGPASYVTTGVYGMFEFKLRAHGGSPNTLLCAVFPVPRCADLHQREYLDFLRPKEREAAASHYRTLFAGFAI